MKDIPIFDTEFGVASLVLREIPYTAKAYIRIQTALDPAQLIQECVTFCRMCGAEQIFAAGDAYLCQYEPVTAVVAMRCDRASVPDSDACLFPVTEETAEQWRTIYNRCMADVPNAAYMDQAQVREMVHTGDGYFVHKDGMLLGIGKASGGTIDAVAAVQPGMGETAVRALVSILQEDTVSVLVADANIRAVRLYERMGFVQTQEVSRWYRVL